EGAPLRDALLGRGGDPAGVGVQGLRCPGTPGGRRRPRGEEGQACAYALGHADGTAHPRGTRRGPRGASGRTAFRCDVHRGSSAGQPQVGLIPARLGRPAPPHVSTGPRAPTSGWGARGPSCVLSRGWVCPGPAADGPPRGSAAYGPPAPISG